MSGRRLAVVGRELCAMLEAVHLVTYMSEEPVEEFEKLGWAGHWPGYFASRSAPLGKVPAAVVDALFYNFAPGEVAAYIPGVWEIATPEQALAAREAGSVRALRRILGKLADSPAVERAAELATRAAFAAPSERRILYAALRTLPVPEEPLARLWHASTLLREHRGDGHYAALVTAGVGGQECHVLEALWLGMPAREYGRLYPLSDDELAAVVEGMRGRGLVGADGWLTAAGRETKERVEEITDALAAPAYAALSQHELEQLAADLAPLVDRIKSVGYERPAA